MKRLNNDELRSMEILTGQQYTRTGQPRKRPRTFVQTRRMGLLDHVTANLDATDPNYSQTVHFRQFREFKRTAPEPDNSNWQPSTRVQHRANAKLTELLNKIKDR